MDLCCDKPRIGFQWALAPTLMDFAVLKVDQVVCLSCGTQWLFDYNDPFIMNQDFTEGSLLLKMKLPKVTVQ